MMMTIGDYFEALRRRQEDPDWKDSLGTDEEIRQTIKEDQEFQAMLMEIPDSQLAPFLQEVKYEN